MATKNIAITLDAYNLLIRNKRPGESFSDLIRGHFKKSKHLSDYAGIWADMPEKEWKAIEAGIETARRGLSKSLKKRTEVLDLNDRSRQRYFDRHTQK